MLRASSRLQGSDNTRHRSHHPVTGEPYLLPPERIRRVVLCTGQMYYRLRCASAIFASTAALASGRCMEPQSAAGCRHLVWACCSNARRAAKVRDIVMVRLEQLAPFPHDLVMKVRMACGTGQMLYMHRASVSTPPIPHV